MEKLRSESVLIEQFLDRWWEQGGETVIRGIDGKPLLKRSKKGTWLIVSDTGEK